MRKIEDLSMYLRKKKFMDDEIRFRIVLDMIQRKNLKAR